MLHRKSMVLSKTNIMKKTKPEKYTGLWLIFVAVYEIDEIMAEIACFFDNRRFHSQRDKNKLQRDSTRAVGSKRIKFKLHAQTESRFEHVFCLWRAYFGMEILAKFSLFC